MGSLTPAAVRSDSCRASAAAGASAVAAGGAATEEITELFWRHICPVSDLGRGTGW